MKQRLGRREVFSAKTRSEVCHREPDLLHDAQHHFTASATSRAAGTLRSPEKKKADAFASAFLFWRSRRDLNPRYPFGVHTISSRARYDHFDTAPWVRHSCRLAYDTTTALICQVVFLLFSFIFANRVREVILRGFSLKNARRNVEGSLIIYPSVEIRGIRIRFFESINRNKKWETTKVVSHFWSECRDSVLFRLSET